MSSALKKQVQPVHFHQSIWRKFTIPYDDNKGLFFNIHIDLLTRSLLRVIWRFQDVFTAEPSRSFDNLNSVTFCLPSGVHFMISIRRKGCSFQEDFHLRTVRLFNSLVSCKAIFLYKFTVRPQRNIVLDTAWLSPRLTPKSMSTFSVTLWIRPPMR
jgi:hypothetical protein